MNSVKAMHGLSVRRASVGLALVLLTGCVAGPDFQRPKPPDVSSYLVEPASRQAVVANTELGKYQRFNTDIGVDSQWWKNLGSAKLDALIVQALKANPTLDSASATLRQAQESYAAKAGSTLYPQLGLEAGAQRQRQSPNALGQVGEAREFSLYNAGIGVQYQLDLAGGNQRALEGLAARAEYQRYELEGARLTVAANVVNAAITQARLAEQILSLQSILHAQEEQLQLSQQQVRFGQAAPSDLLSLQAQVEQTRAGIPALRQQRQLNDHMLSVLLGQAPGKQGLPEFTLQEFTLPSDLPLILPSELVRRRPDIQGAEALLHAANAEYGVAIANMYPQLNISASLGSQALSTGMLFGGGSAVWGLLAQLTQPLFNPGLPAEKRASLAALDAAAAHYQSVVLEALRDVADTLRALENNAEVLAAQTGADKAANDAWESVQRQHAFGAASYLQLLIAQQQAQQYRIDLISAKAQRLVDSAALYQAFGGGLEADPDLI